MGQAIKPIAVVVEDDYFQCEALRELLESNDMQVIRCESAEGAGTTFTVELPLAATDTAWEEAA